jgi:DNA-directed RNA polymerase specialized sigma24 family protein
MSLSSDTSITQWLKRVQQGPDDSAAAMLWQRYCRRLAEVARRRLRELGARCRAGDEADAVQEAFAAFFRRVKEGAYPDCHDRNELWCLLRGQLQGYTHQEIARQIGCVTRTVERKLKVIRNRWREVDER